MVFKKDRLFHHNDIKIKFEGKLISWRKILIKKLAFFPKKKTIFSKLEFYSEKFKLLPNIILMPCDAEIDFLSKKFHKCP